MTKKLVNIALKVETDETTKYNFKKIGFENNKIKIQLFSNIIFVNEKQYELINNIMEKYNLSNEKHI